MGAVLRGRPFSLRTCRHAVRRYAKAMRRIFALFLLLAIVPGVLWRDARHVTRGRSDIVLQPLALPDIARDLSLLGPFSLEAAWNLQGPKEAFGSYSALVPLENRQLLAISDTANLMVLPSPGRGETPRLRAIPVNPYDRRFGRDIEAATRDPATGTLWLAWEWSNTISRHSPDLTRTGMAGPGAMRDWTQGFGPEAMVRLADGRFIVLHEGFSSWWDWRLHEALLFDGDPVAGTHPRAFTFAGTDGFRPTDMTQLPDGRILVLMRKMTWPVPIRFEGRIVLADPAEITPGKVWQGKTLARIEDPLPHDNFEGMAVTPRDDGKLDVWLISDSNGAVFQRTLLWRMVLDPKDLPPGRRKAREG